MIKMSVCEEYVSVNRLTLIKRLTQIADTGTRIQNDQVITATNFEARSVAAIAEYAGIGAWNASTNSPKLHTEYVRSGQMPPFGQRSHHQFSGVLCLTVI